MAKKKVAKKAAKKKVAKKSQQVQAPQYDPGQRRLVILLKTMGTPWHLNDGRELTDTEEERRAEGKIPTRRFYKEQRLTITQAELDRYALRDGVDYMDLKMWIADQAKKKEQADVDTENQQPDGTETEGSTGTTRGENGDADEASTDESVSTED